jgi:hypothetical protein
MTDRRQFLAFTGLAAAGMILPRGLFAFTPPVKIPMTVYKSPTCGCCHAWVDYVTANGFDPKVIDVADQARLNDIKTTSGVPPEVRSCHMALVGDYAVEGHVPVDLIQKMLREKPQGRGLAIPGMIVGSPGMEVSGVPARPYNVLLFQRDGSSRVYASK